MASETQCALTGVTPAQYGHVVKVNASLFGYNAIMGGNADLQPETATTRTIGMVLEPRFLRGFNATIDWWDIKLKGAISKIGAQTIVDSCIASGDPIFCSRIHRDPNGSLWLGNGYVDDRQANLGALQVRGIDGGADYSARLGRLGSANFEFRGSYVLHWIIDNGGLSTPYDCAGLFGDPCGMQPRWRHMARATWNTPLANIRVASMAAHGRREARRARSQIQSDGRRSVRRTRSWDRGTISTSRPSSGSKRRFELRLGVNNVLDRQPPLVVSNTAAGGGPINGNTYPEWYDPLGRYIFASVSVDFKP